MSTHIVSHFKLCTLSTSIPSSFFVLDKDTWKMQFIARDLGNEGWCACVFFDDETRVPMFPVFIVPYSSLIYPRTILKPEAVKVVKILWHMFITHLTRLLHMEAALSALHCLNWNIYSFLPITPFIILSQVTNPDSHLEARMLQCQDIY